MTNPFNPGAGSIPSYFAGREFHMSKFLQFLKEVEFGKFYPHKLYADAKKLVLELGYLQIPPDDEDPKIILLVLKKSSDEKIIKIWQLARKAFTPTNPTFLNEILDYVNHKKWDV